MKIWTLFIVLTISSCATPPGQLTDDDFLIKKYHVQMPLDIAVSNFHKGLRYCGPSIGMFSDIKNFGIADCPPAIKKESLQCDIYAGGPGGERSPFVLGRVNFKQTKNGTDIELRSQTWITNNHITIESWELFIQNKAEQACPPIDEYKTLLEDEL